jgi:heme exporter protein A
MINYSLELQSVTKIFGRRLIFEKLDYKFSSGKIYGISGPNGSGKSTLAKIIAGLLSQTSGKVIHYNNTEIIPAERLHNYVGFNSPYLFLYDEFTAEENLVHFSNIRGMKFEKEKSDFYFNELGLSDRKNDLLKGYSSGMKQRLKFIFALLHSPRLILLDEPTSNLDNAGKEKVYELIKERAKENVVIIASNEDPDLALCGNIIDIKKYKKS